MRKKHDVGSFLLLRESVEINRKVVKSWVGETTVEGNK
jgi:hypothetical protein